MHNQLKDMEENDSDEDERAGANNTIDDELSLAKE